MVVHLAMLGAFLAGVTLLGLLGYWIDRGLVRRAEGRRRIKRRLEI